MNFRCDTYSHIAFIGIARDEIKEDDDWDKIFFTDTNAVALFNSNMIVQGGIQTEKELDWGHSFLSLNVDENEDDVLKIKSNGKEIKIEEITLPLYVLYGGIEKDSEIKYLGTNFFY